MALNPPGPGNRRSTAFMAVNTPNTATSLLVNCCAVRLVKTTIRQSPSSNTVSKGASLAWAIAPVCGNAVMKNG